MVMQVSIFQNASDDFYRALVMKLSPLICIAGDYVFYKGEHGSRMYFIKKGRVQVECDGVTVRIPSHSPPLSQSTVMPL